MQRTPFFAKDYQRPDLDAARADSARLAQALTGAPSGAAAADAVREWNRLRSRLDTLFNVASVRYQQDTTDPAARAEQDFWNDAAPVMRELEVMHARALLGSPHRDALAREFGAQLFRLKDNAAATFAPEIAEQLAEEARLVTRYTELTSKPEVSFRGQSYTLMGIARFFTDGDRQTRLEAHQARERFLVANGEELDSIYDRLVKLRHQMGRALGNDDFIPLGYRLMNRCGYGPAEVAAFRSALRAEIVPLAVDMKRGQRERLGVDKVLFHDELVRDPQGNARPTGDPPAILAAARRMYAELHPELGEFIDMMVAKELMDVELRDGKAPGGFCTAFADLKVPFVFASFNGTEDDIHVITHECGHAFQCWSSRHLPLVDFAFPTAEAAEIHSMSMEYMTYPWMELFFAPGDADRYRRTHLERAIDLLPYCAAVDHFQEEIYRNPSLSPAQRHALWRDMERAYLPFRDYGGHFPHFEAGGLWQRQLHIYGMPFYYVDYALAEVCALQFHAKIAADRKAALADYLAICRVGGSLSFTDILTVGKLASPFDPSTIAQVARHVRSHLAS
ncbi:MAG TPA: M3 family oligoendopeptidase [Kofleriaceae bacterium]|nr:M3 family oligoendopeptidase [Kofleriaceae bacterium]